MFFTITFVLFDPSHFLDAFHPFVWKWVIVYTVIVIVFGQLLWFQSISKVKSSTISMASSCLPIAGILFAFLLLNERPQWPVLLGGTIIIAGLIISNMGTYVGKKNKEAIDMSVGFKGV